jgi:hypothetical protein
MLIVNAIATVRLCPPFHHRGSGERGDAHMTKRSLMESYGSGMVAQLERDHFDCDGFCLLSDGTTIWLSEQVKGSPPSQSFEIPKYVLDRLLEMYQRPQVVTTKEK